MLETSARRALHRLGFRMVRIAEGGYQVSNEQSVWHLADLEAIGQFILERRNLAVTRLAQDGKEAQTVEVPTRGFTKVVATKPVRFICAGCGQEFEQERYPSRRAAQGLLYHSDECREEAERKKTRERVARYREGKRKQT